MLLRQLDYFSADKTNFMSFLTINHEWWEKADTFKQNCFYVDYGEKIITPANITKEAYQDAEKRIREFTTDLRITILFIQKTSQEQLNKYRKILKETETRELFESTIGRSSVRK